MVLGRTPGRTSTVCTILGLQDLQQGTDAAPGEECSKHTAEVAGRKVGMKTYSDISEKPVYLWNVQNSVCNSNAFLLSSAVPAWVKYDMKLAHKCERTLCNKTYFLHVLSL